MTALQVKSTIEDSLKYKLAEAVISDDQTALSEAKLALEVINRLDPDVIEEIIREIFVEVTGGR